MFEWLFGKTSAAKLRDDITRTIADGGDPEQHFSAVFASLFADELAHVARVRIVSYATLMSEVKSKALEHGISIQTLIIGYHMATSDGIVKSVHDITTRKLSVQVREYLAIAAQFGVERDTAAALALQLRTWHLSLMNQLAREGESTLVTHHEKVEEFLGMVNLTSDFDRRSPDSRYFALAPA